MDDKLFNELVMSIKDAGQFWRSESSIFFDALSLSQAEENPLEQEIANNVKWHQEWQAQLDKNAFFDDVFK